MILSFRHIIRAFFVGSVLLTKTSIGFASPIVVTVHPIKILLTDLGVSADSITTLIPPGIDPHSFEMVPSQVKLLNDASIIVTSSGVELNQSIAKNPMWSQKIKSIGDSSLLTEHGWLNPELVFRSLPELVKDLEDKAKYEVTPGQLLNFKSRLQEVLSVKIPVECAFVSDHSMLSSFAQYISCKEVGTLRKGNGTTEFTPRSLQKISEYKHDYPQLIFIGSSSSPRSIYNTLHEHFELPTQEVDESAQKENSFIEYYRSIISAFVKRGPGL